MPLLLSLAWRNSASRRQRTLLTVLAVALGVGLILATQLIGSALSRQLRASAEQLVGRSDAEVFGFAQQGFSQDMVKVIAALPQVATAAPVVSKRLVGRVNSDSQTFDLLGIDPLAEQRLHPLTVVSGRLIAADDKAGVMLDDVWARAHGLRVGSKIGLFTSLGLDEYTVRALLRDSSFTQSAYGPVVFVPLPSAQHAFRLGAHVTQVSVGLTHGSSGYSAFREDLRRAAIEEYTVRDNHAFAAAQPSPFAEIQPVMVFFTLLAFAIGIFLIYNNLAVTVIERRREIGLLRAAGATSGWIAQLFLVQAAVLGLLGSAVGLIVGVAVAEVLGNYLQGQAVGGNLNLALELLPFVEAVLLGVAATLLAGALPARRAALLPPMQALRPESPYMRERSLHRVTAAGIVVTLTALTILALSFVRPPAIDPSADRLILTGAGMLLLFAGVLMLTPVLVRPVTAMVARPIRLMAPGETMLARNAMIRRPNRSALTVAGLLVSSALVISVAGLNGGALNAGKQWVDSLFVSDRLVVSPVQQSEQIRKQINTLPGVTATSPIAFFTLRSTERAVNMAAIDPLDYAARGRLQFAVGDRQSAFTQLEEGRAVFIPRRMADARHLSVGDQVPLGGSGPEIAYKVAAVITHGMPSPGGEETSLISSANARQDFGVQGFNILQVITSRSPSSTFDDSLSRQARQLGMQLESINDVRAGVKRGLDSLLFLLTGVSVAGVILGLMSVVMTILLNVSESTREFGLLRAVGVTREQVRGIILTQSSLFGLSGALMGALVGLLLTSVMSQAASSAGFELGYSVPWEAIILVVAVSLLGSLLAVALPARRAAGLSVVAAVRYE
jgi:putative ABC transport system permease protein